MLAHNLQHACDYKRSKSNFHQRPLQSQASSDNKHFNKGNLSENKQSKVTDTGKSQRYSNQCFVCGKTNHIARNCFHNIYNKPKVNCMKSNPDSPVTVPNDPVKPTKVEKVTENTQSESNLVLSLMCSDPFKEVRTEGTVNGFQVDVLRDSGSSEFVVAKKYVLDSQFTGRDHEIIFLDNSRCNVKEAFVDIDCPYLKGKVKASVMENPLFDVVVGNVPGVINVRN